VGDNLDPHLASIERMCYAVMRSVENLVERQTQLWRTSLGDVEQQWRENWISSSEHFRSALTGSLEHSLEHYADRLAQVEQQATVAAERRWERWQQVLESNAQLLRDQQESGRQQAEILGRVVDAAGDVVRLEKTLNDNLQALSGARHFEEMMMSLTAAIQLLSTRAGAAAGQSRVDLRSATSQSERAA
jgi:hypothetical protein